MRDHNLTVELTRAHKSLNNTRHLHCKSSGLTRDHTLAADPTSTHKPPKPHQTRCDPLGHMKHHTITAKRTSIHKLPKPNLTTTMKFLGLYKGPQPHHEAHKPLNHIKHLYSSFMKAFLLFLYFLDLLEVLILTYTGQKCISTQKHVIESHYGVFEQFWLFNKRC